MPSQRARLTNEFLRMTTKSMWKPDLDIVAIRAHMARMDARIGRRPLQTPTESVDFAGVPATWIGEKALEETGTILYIHGGAWCIHAPATYARFAASLSAATGMRVLLIDYRLAPEHRFPAGTDDCLAVYLELIKQGYHERPLVVAGDSAGGNLTLVTLQRARDANLPMPCCAIPISPSTDMTMSGPSGQYNAVADPMFSLAAAEIFPNIYCPGEDPTNPMISPLFGNWWGLPPLLFHAGSTELLLDDSVRAQDRARQAGVEAHIQVWVDMPHVFHVFHWLPEARMGIAAIAHFIAAKAKRPSEAVPYQVPDLARIESVGGPVSTAAR
jgi:epsilon-lactone hydrolase